MKRLAMSMLTAIAIAATPATAPAQSRIEGQEILGILLGLGALAAIASEVNDREEEEEKKKQRTAARKAKKAQQARQAHQARRAAAYYDEFRYDRWNRTPVRGANVLPVHCTRADISVNRSPVLGGRCLRRFDVPTRTLPEKCRRRADTRDGQRTVFIVRCLNRSGYRVARLN